MIPGFNGTHINWLRYWNQFGSEIDLSCLLFQTFLILELILLKVRVIIEQKHFDE